LPKICIWIWTVLRWGQKTKTAACMLLFTISGKFFFYSPNLTLLAKLIVHLALTNF
jgi:hypothetical protein